DTGPTATVQGLRPTLTCNRINDHYVVSPGPHPVSPNRPLLVRRWVRLLVGRRFGNHRSCTENHSCGVNVRTVRRWAKGEHEVPIAVELLLRAAAKRVRDLAEE